MHWVPRYLVAALLSMGVILSGCQPADFDESGCASPIVASEDGPQDQLYCPES